MKRLIMELLGTFFLVLAVAMTGNALAVAAMLIAGVISARMSPAPITTRSYLWQWH